MIFKPRREAEEEENMDNILRPTGATQLQACIAAWLIFASGVLAWLLGWLR